MTATAISSELCADLASPSLGKKTDDDMLEFKKVGEESVKLKIDEIIKIINSKKN